jgi:metal-responsive CopG/Arc/MetJ family transcriptional regulator
MRKRGCQISPDRLGKGSYKVLPDGTKVARVTVTFEKKHMERLVDRAHQRGKGSVSSLIRRYVIQGLKRDKHEVEQCHQFLRSLENASDK